MEAGARIAGSRFAFLKGDLVLLELALVRWALERARRPRLRARDPAGARARGGAVRHRLPARHRAADLPAGRRRAVPRRHERGRARLAARRRDARRGGRCRCATRASRPASGARPAPPAATRAASSACTSSTRSRCSASCARRTSLDEHERLLAIEEEILQALEHPLPRGQHRGRRPRRLGGQEVRLRGVAAGPAALPRADLDLEHDRLPGPPARHPVPAGGRRQAARTPTRSTAPRSRSGGT